MIVDKHDGNGRTKAERRRNDYLKAKRKQTIAESIYSDSKEHPYYNNLHQYSKNKIHCSCPLCAAKTKNSKLGGKYNYTTSESKIQESLINKMNEYFNEEVDTRNIYDKYDDYLEQHIGNVNKGYSWLKENLPEIFDEVDIEMLDAQIASHDESKYSDAEYSYYANYFYGEPSDKNNHDFDLAWLHHQHQNMHHWQYWLLQNDEDGLTILDMPYEYIIEMISDWWAFSWMEDNLFEIFNWYDKQKDNIMISESTREEIENVLDKMRKKLEK